MNTHSALRNPNADCTKPGMDIFANKKRVILHSDLVHESVSRREMAARRFPANNPPISMQVVNDQGNLLPKGFEEC
jgi:hypothetical protein